MKKVEMKFWKKIILNGCVLSGLMFASMWATTEISLHMAKTISVFFIGYFFTEMARHLKLTPTTKEMEKQTFKPMIF